jgi:hypothetical protein
VTTGGSENFTCAIIEELLRLNYDVEYFTLTKDNIHKSIQRNCTGTRAFTEDEFIAELRKYRPENGNDMRKIACNYSVVA